MFHLTKIIIKCQIYRSRMYSDGFFLEDRVMNANARTNHRRLWLPVLTAAGLVILTGTDSARAGRRHRIANRPVGRVWVEPIYETRARTVVVPAVFETRARRVWHEPVYETRRVSVEIPAEIVQRRVPRYAECGRLIGNDTVEEVIQPARTVRRFEEVLVHPGHNETVYDRVLVRPETTRLAYERVLVRPGTWESGRRIDRLPRHRGHRQGRHGSFSASVRRGGGSGGRVSFGRSR